ncbi:MAG: methyltransferase [Frankiales bacterium]|nr:methyltransferase [Frankiales bacterium]
MARHLFEECAHKKAQRVFANPNTFFYQRNVLTGPVFAPRTIDTTLSFALTHEVYSYGGGAPALEAFARTIHDHTRPDGVWINSDVLGPEAGGRQVLLLLRRDGRRCDPVDLAALEPADRTAHLDGLDGRSLLDQFALDFRRGTGRPFPHDVEEADGAVRVTVGLADALELLTKASYTDNWLSETCEQFTALAWSDWVRLCTDVGFEVDPRSGPWRNDWLVENRFDPWASLAELDGTPLPWPDTHVLLVARRPPA